MSLISIRKYLDGATLAPKGETGCLPECLEFLDTAIPLLRAASGAAAGGGAMTGDPVTGAGVRADAFREATEYVKEWSEANSRKEREQREDIQRLMAVFNQAVMALAAGGERAADRLTRVESSLSRAALMDTLPAMRGALHEAVETLRREAEAQTAETAGKVAEFGKRLEDARSRSSFTGSLHPGRGQAIAMIRSLQTEAGIQTAIVAAVIERLPAMRARFGAAVAAEAFHSLASELAAAAAGGAVYCWREDTLLWRVEREAAQEGHLAGLRQQIERQFSEPFEYRTIAAGRTAVLSLRCRWMWCAIGQTPADQLIAEIDMFSAGDLRR